MPNDNFRVPRPALGVGVYGGLQRVHPQHRLAYIQDYAFDDFHPLFVMENHDFNVSMCCLPTGCAEDDPIHLDNLQNAVRVVCNNEQCSVGQYMHKDCFEAWEQSVLTYLRSTGRARSWSEKQRLQNLWTKKGYDLAFKACSCKCGKGHLRKDLDWAPPNKGNVPVDDARKKKNRRKKNDKPILGGGGSLGMGMTVASPREGRPMLRLRSNSMSSTGSNSGSSPPSSNPGESPCSPSHLLHMATANHANGSGGVIVLTNGRRRSSKFEFFSDRLGNGSIFSRRLDYSSFNSLPRHKINSYHIKVRTVDSNTSLT